MTTPLHLRYRPKTFADVIGQGAVIKSLQQLLEARASQAFLLSGPSGVGKTTLARICAAKLDCRPSGIIEIDGATYSGIDNVRQLQQALPYVPMGNSTTRVIILDEAHALSRQAWQALLKSIEEPPAHAYWFICTTDASKIPLNIKTRCTPLALKGVSDKDLVALCERVCDAEKIKMPVDVVNVIVAQAQNSPRQMLVNLALVRGLTDRKQVASILHKALESDPTRALCQFLIKGGSWPKAMQLVADLANEPPESVRIVVCNYMGGALRNVKGERDAVHFLNILDKFATPYNAAEQQAPLLLSIGRVLFGDE